MLYKEAPLLLRKIKNVLSGFEAITVLLVYFLIDLCIALISSVLLVFSLSSYFNASTCRCSAFPQTMHLQSACLFFQYDYVLPNNGDIIMLEINFD